MPPGVEKATRGSYARAQLKIVEVNGSPSHTRWENTPRFAEGDHCLYWPPLRPTVCSSPQGTTHPPSWKRCWIPDSLGAESKGSPSYWARTARPSIFSSPSRGATRLGRGGRSNGRWAGARPTPRHGPPTGGHTSSHSWEEFCERVRQEDQRTELERLESLRQWRQEARDLQHAREALGRRVSREELAGIREKARLGTAQQWREASHATRRWPEGYQNGDHRCNGSPCGRPQPQTAKKTPPPRPHRTHRRDSSTSRYRRRHDSSHSRRRRDDGSSPEEGECMSDEERRRERRHSHRRSRGERSLT